MVLYVLDHIFDSFHHSFFSVCCLSYTSGSRIKGKFLSFPFLNNTFQRSVSQHSSAKLSFQNAPVITILLCYIFRLLEYKALSPMSDSVIICLNRRCARSEQSRKNCIPTSIYCFIFFSVFHIHFMVTSF